MGRSLNRKIAAYRADHPEATHTQAQAAVLSQGREGGGPRTRAVLEQTWDGETFTPCQIGEDRHVRELDRHTALLARFAAASTGFDALRVELRGADGNPAVLDTAHTNQHRPLVLLHGAVVGCEPEVFDALMEKFSDSHPAALQVFSLDLRPGTGLHPSVRCAEAQKRVRELVAARESRLRGARVKDIAEHRGHPSPDPLPYLVMAVRTTAAVLNAHDAAGDALSLITRTGRALGMHLLLEIDDIDQVAERAFAEHIGYVISPSDIAGVVRVWTR